MASEYKAFAWVRIEKIFALSDAVAIENSDDRLQIVPVEILTTPFAISEMHCLVFAMDTL